MAHGHCSRREAYGSSVRLPYTVHLDSTHLILHTCQGVCAFKLSRPLTCTTQPLQGGYCKLRKAASYTLHFT